MITRLVETGIRPEMVDAFIDLYMHARPTILAQPGCPRVELVPAIDQPTLFATWSVWDHESALDAYRTGAFFRDFWPGVRVLFRNPPHVQPWTPVELE